MKPRTAGKPAIGLFMLLLLLPASSPVRAEPSTAVRQEIDHLLHYVGDSGCEFYRNGSWYDGKKGQSHLQMKYDYLVGRDEIRGAADFIDKAGTQSSFTSLPYKV